MFASTHRHGLPSNFPPHRRTFSFPLFLPLWNPFVSQPTHRCLRSDPSRQYCILYRDYRGSGVGGPVGIGHSVVTREGGAALGSVGRSARFAVPTEGAKEGRRRHFPEALDPSLRPSVRSLGPRRTLARQTFPERDFPSMQSVRQSIFAMIAAILEELNLCLVSHSRVEKGQQYQSGLTQLI